MILVYTGDGKGKTSACVGQAMRALGHGHKVAFCQFMKRPDVAGEQAMLSRLLGNSYRAGGPGFLRDASDLSGHMQSCRALLAWAAIQPVSMIIMDEAIYALHYQLISRDDLMPFLDQARGVNEHLVLSGRHAPDWLIHEANLVTEMRSVKHPLDQGVTAMAGIEY